MISLSSRCYCGKLPGSHAANKLHLQPSFVHGLIWGTHRGMTAQHSEMPRPPLFAFLPSWKLGSGWLSCRDSALWFSVVALSYHWAVCCWKDTKRIGIRTHRAEYVVYAPLLRSCGVQLARQDLLAVHLPVRVRAKLGVEAVDFEVSRHFAMNDPVMRGKDCDWKEKHDIFYISSNLFYADDLL